MRTAQTNRSVRIHPGKISLAVKPFLALAIAAAAFCLISIRGAEPAPPAMSAAELADQLDVVSQGRALIRTKLEVRSLEGAKRVLQLQIKQRRTKTTTDLVYQVLWPTSIRAKPFSCTSPWCGERLSHRSAAASSRDQGLANERGIVRQ
jgi:hypothetical protein